MNLSEDDRQAILEMLREAATTEIMPRFGAISPADRRTKSAADDLVTDADIGAERLITDRLLARFPGALVVGEEAAFADPSLPSRIDSAELAFVIDPVDGTWNFAHGIPVFATILAVVRRGETVAGFIHFPIRGDRVEAHRGEGAWHVSEAGSRTRVAAAAPRPAHEMMGAMALANFPAADRLRMAPRLPALRTTSLRCSAWEHRLLAEGSLDFSMNDRPKPWDHAAGVLIHAEAGGHAALTDGRPYRAGITGDHLLLAPDATSWTALRVSLLGDADH